MYCHKGDTQRRKGFVMEVEFSELRVGQVVRIVSGWTSSVSTGFVKSVSSELVVVNSGKSGDMRIRPESNVRLELV